MLVVAATVLSAGLCAGGLYLAGGAGGSGGSGALAGPSESDGQQEVVDQLARATEAHGICYGWRLSETDAAGTLGSNLGAGKPVTGDPTKCARYVEVVGKVVYYPESSESEDEAILSISSNLPGSDKLDPAVFERLGAGTGTLLNEPADTILTAAQLLPLLTMEAGLATAPVPQPSPTGTVQPVAMGGSDFWRDRAVLVFIAAALLVAALLTLLFGTRVVRWISPHDKLEAPGRPATARVRQRPTPRPSPPPQ
ncbi:MAG TPA: hypothetical protein VK453_16965 [Micromonosporaceae bacterium]|nr:hypothetical protein [Micromonosporaceae bacterium]